MRDCARYLQSVESIRGEAILYKGGGFAYEKGNFFLLVVIAPILLGLKIKDIDKYNEITNGDGFEIFKEITKSNDIITAALDLLLFEEKISATEKTVTIENFYHSLFSEINGKGFSNSKISIEKEQIIKFFKKVGNLGTT